MDLHGSPCISMDIHTPGFIRIPGGLTRPGCRPEDSADFVQGSNIHTDLQFFQGSSEMSAGLLRGLNQCLLTLPVNIPGRLEFDTRTYYFPGG